MSGLHRGYPTFLIDSAGATVGFMGREWLFPAALTVAADGGAALSSGRMLYDDTGTPQGISIYGREFAFGSAFTLNTTAGLRRQVRPFLVNAQGVPVGVAGVPGAASIFPTPPTEGGSSVAADADVTAYAAAVTTAGGTLPASHQLALNTYMPALKASGAWALIKEMWLPLGNDGDLTTAAVKLKNGVTGVPSVTLTNFVTGDYTVAGGMDPQVANSTKKILTGFVPSTASLNGVLATGEWGFGVYSMRPTTSATGALMGTVTGQASYLQYTGNSSSIIANSSAILGNPDAGPIRTKRWVGIQVSANVGTYYMGGYARNTGAIASPTAVAVALGVLTANAGLFSDAAVGGYAIHSTLTPAQIRAVQTFYDNVGTAIGRSVWIDTLIADGDSYVAPAPTGPSVAANDWVALVAGVKGWAYALNGISGRTWGPASGGNMVGNSGVASVALNMAATASRHVFFPLGINDANFSGTAAQVTSATNAVLDVVTAMGYPMGYVALGTGYWASTLNATLQAQIAAATIACGSAYGVNVCDFYSGSTFGVTGVETSGIHKNDAGHVLMKNDAISAMAGWAGW